MLANFFYLACQHSTRMLRKFRVFHSAVKNRPRRKAEAKCCTFRSKSLDRLRLPLSAPAEQIIRAGGFFNSAPDDSSFWVNWCRSASFSQVSAISRKATQCSDLAVRCEGFAATGNL